MMAAIIADVAAGKLTVPIDRDFALADAVAAHRHVAEGHPFGRVMMRVGC
jgi:NADPH:quinone reductase-like Zn-dependent oxidoreductase